MKKLYQRTFEQVLAQTCPPLNRVEEQRRALASRCSHTESEVRLHHPRRTCAFR